ncbi:Crp/Fnr family transcriptional regulator [Candidatus Chloroploca asiatica]|uniref:Cyclic nucleotide-binding protein n=1 Tax=Candidatus Chloroploca asiatica TaxID=1506545 RepID=A0A2H3L3J5_9CHLR|nr:Crp/Fnr family transcriptional regulator [Candidatus Chloroploca asiatica]PDV99348.1 cyclic nucleotide-binding protein [Candidatus Chloroploca asiatica]
MNEVLPDKLSYLRDIDIFRDLAPDEVELLGKRAPMQQVASGTVFFSPEEAPEVLFILKEGRVRLYRLSADGKALTTAMLDAGTIFGEMAMLGQRLHQSYAEAMGPCLLCLMSREDVKSMLLSDPRIAARIAEILGQRLITAEQRLSDFAFKSLPQRMAGLLLELARPPKPRLFRQVVGPPEVRFTHEALGEMSGTYRETATKILNEFRSMGLIELKRGCVILLDEAGLRELSEHVELR